MRNSAKKCDEKMRAIIKYYLIMAKRDNIYISLIIMSLALTFLSMFLGSTALSETENTKIIYSAGSIRVLIILGLIIFTSLNINRMFYNKEIDLLLSRPISRTSFIVSYIAGNALLSLLLVVSISIALYMLFSPNLQGLLCWTLNIVLETNIMLSFAVALSLIINNVPITVIASVSFYILSRLSGFLIGANINDDPSNLTNHSNISSILIKIIDYTMMGIPRLDIFSKSEWLIYGITNPNHAVFIPIIQSIMYIALMISIAIYDVNKKEF